jgi:hypothetical protein
MAKITKPTVTSSRPPTRPATTIRLATINWKRRMTTKLGRSRKVARRR